MVKYDMGCVHNLAPVSKLYYEKHARKIKLKPAAYGAVKILECVYCKKLTVDFKYDVVKKLAEENKLTYRS